MATTVSGTTGIDKVQDGIIGTDDLAAGAVTPAKTQLGALPSCVRLSGTPSPQFGTTNTFIRRFLTTHLNQGSDVTYADTAAAGGSFTINTNGVYAVSYTDNAGAAATFGISLNSTQLTIGVQSINQADQLSVATSAAANYIINSAWTGYLPAGSVIRAHGGASAATQNISFCIQRVA